MSHRHELGDRAAHRDPDERGAAGGEDPSGVQQPYDVVGHVFIAVRGVIAKLRGEASRLGGRNGRHSDYRRRAAGHRSRRLTRMSHSKPVNEDKRRSVRVPKVRTIQRKAVHCHRAFGASACLRRHHSEHTRRLGSHATLARKRARASSPSASAVAPDTAASSNSPVPLVTPAVSSDARRSVPAIRVLQPSACQRLRVVTRTCFIAAPSQLGQGHR